MEKLIQAIVERAASDYRDFRRHKASQEKIREIELFFVSDCGMLLTYGRGEYILERLKKEFERDDE